MFKEKPAKGRSTAKSEETRRRIYETAMRIFRRKGFDETTMREIAQQAGMALGAAYYYFSSKEAIVLAFYEFSQTEHERRWQEWKQQDAGKSDLRARLGVQFHAKLDVLEGDRKLMGALLRYAGTPDHPLSFFGPGTAQMRQRSIATLADALSNEDLPKDIKPLVPLAFWALQMGVLLYFLHDKSPGAKKTRKLIDMALDQSVRFLAVVRFPLLKPLRTHITGMLKELDLIEATA